MDFRLKLEAVFAWASGLALTFLTDADHARWVSCLALGCFAAGGTLTACVAIRSGSRHTRRAFYRHRRWDDNPEATVLQLLRRPDAVDSSEERALARRGSP
jgi:hypothetical protein